MSPDRVFHLSGVDSLERKQFPDRLESPQVEIPSTEISGVEFLYPGVSLETVQTVSSEIPNQSNSSHIGDPSKGARFRHIVSLIRKQFRMLLPIKTSRIPDEVRERLMSHRNDLTRKEAIPRQSENSTGIDTYHGTPPEREVPRPGSATRWKQFLV